MRFPAALIAGLLPAAAGDLAVSLKTDAAGAVVELRTPPKLHGAY